MLHRYLNSALVESAYEVLKDGERERAWTLSHMVAFWTAVILRAPPSLSHALRRGTGDPSSGYPNVDASNQAFFQRSSHLRWEFFAEVFRAFVRDTASEQPCFAQQHADVAERFEQVLVLDGSYLDPVARRLKILWKDPAVPIPGVILACYDLMRGTLADLHFAPSPKMGELTLARTAMEHSAEGVLFVGDRLYGTPKFLQEVHDSGRFGVFRLQSQSKIDRKEHLSHEAYRDGTLDDWSVDFGAKAKFPARLICLTQGEKTYQFITNVLDPQRLSACEAADIYGDRWEVENMFFDLKRVLNLHCFYCGNTNAIALQVYAAAIVYTAMRMAQGRIANDANVEPEMLSTGKLFPLLGAASATVTTLEWGFLQTEYHNPTLDISKPDWRSASQLQIPLRDLLRDTTRGTRPRTKRKKTPHPTWTPMPPPKRPRDPP